MRENDKEYAMLRKEIESSINIVHTSINILYVGLTAILAWAIDAKNSLLCLSAYCIVVPIYFVTLSYQLSMLKIGAYLSVFYKKYNWEKRLHKFHCRSTMNRHERAYRMPFIFSSLMCTIIFFILFDYQNIDFIKWIEIVVCLIIFISFTGYIILQKSNDKIKQIYIAGWQDIKCKEK